MAGPFASRVELKNEELIAFEDGPSQDIMEEIHQFWKVKARYEKLGVPYRRGVLMHGIPGTGKSGVVRMVCDQVIEKDGLVILVKRARDFTGWLPILNQVEPNRHVVVVLEDLDEIYEYDEQECLQMLDGIGNDRPGLLFLATTNFLSEIPSRIYRPSRFDLLIEVGAPSASVREQYVRALCKRFEVEHRSDIVEASEGLSFAHLKEILVSCLLYERPVEEMVERMKNHAAQEEEEDDE
jgi:SpoVK/Ycf46/Vps4 family AAA+-type ATPase